MTVRNLIDIPYKAIPRIPSGIEEFDWLYGGENGNWGIPEGKISLIAGEKGCGKSKAVSTIVKKMTRFGYVVLYIQNEIDLNSFRGWVSNKENSGLSFNFKASESNNLEAQISDIISCSPHLVIIDSINETEEFGNGCQSYVKEIVNRLRIVCRNIGCHIILISQVNNDGEIKASSALPHLVDIVLYAKNIYHNKVKIDNHFIIRIGEKNRYGRTASSIFSIWKHTEDGAICISDNRLCDEVWCEHHGIFTKEAPSIKIIDGRIMTKVDDPISGSYLYS